MHARAQIVEREVKWNRLHCMRRARLAQRLCLLKVAASAPPAWLARSVIFCLLAVLLRRSWAMEAVTVVQLERGERDRIQRARTTNSAPLPPNEPREYCFMGARLGKVPPSVR